MPSSTNGYPTVPAEHQLQRRSWTVCHLLLLMLRNTPRIISEIQATQSSRDMSLCWLLCRLAGSGQHQKGETVCAAPRPWNLGNCTCNFPSCWRGWGHARRQYLRSRRDQEDSPGTHDFVPPALPAARLLCNAARTGFPGPSLPFFSISQSTTPAVTRSLIQWPMGLGSCCVCLSFCQLV